MSSLARIIETTLSVLEVSDQDPTEAVSLNGADKYSVQVSARVGDSIAHLEGSNTSAASAVDADWTEIASASIAEGASHMFEQPNVAYRWARVSIENDDSGDVSADCLFLVIGDAV